MKRKVWTEQELVAMPQNEFEMTWMLLRLGCFHMLGIPWKRYIRAFRDPVNGSIVVEYE